MTCVWCRRQCCLGCCATTHGSSAAEVALFRAVSPDPILLERFRSMENCTKHKTWWFIFEASLAKCLDFRLSFFHLFGFEAWHVCYSLQVLRTKTSTLSLPNCSTTCIEMLLLCSRRTHKRREDVERPITNCRRSSLIFRFRWYCWGDLSFDNLCVVMVNPFEL